MEFQALENVDRKGGIQHKITDNPTTDDGIKQEELAKKYWEGATGKEVWTQGECDIIKAIQEGVLYLVEWCW